MSFGPHWPKRGRCAIRRMSVFYIFTRSKPTRTRKSICMLWKRDRKKTFSLAQNVVKRAFYLVNNRVCMRSAVVCDERVKNGHFMYFWFYALSFPYDISPVRETVDIETSAEHRVCLPRPVDRPYDRGATVTLRRTRFGLFGPNGNK